MVSLGLGLGLSKRRRGGAGGGAPAGLAINFGAKTRRGHGGYDLGSPVTITSGNTGSVWTVDARNHLVLAGTVAAAPPALSASYSLGLSDGRTAEVTVIPNAAHVQVASDAASTVANFQPRSLEAALVQGDTVWFRDGDYNPAAVGRVQFGPSVNTGAFTGSNYIHLRAENPGMVNIFRIAWVPGAVAGNVARLRISDINHHQLANTGTPTGTYAMQHGTGTGTNQSFTYGPLFERISVEGKIGSATGTDSTAGVYAAYLVSGHTVQACRFVECNFRYIGGKCTTLTGNVELDRCNFRDNWDDHIYIGKQNGSIITNCLFHSPLYTSGAHADHIQYDQSGVLAGTYTGPTVQNNVMIYGDSTSAALKQGIFMSNNAAGVFYTGTDISNNLLVHGEVNALNVSGLDGGGYTRNTVVTERLDNTSIALTKVTNSQNAAITNSIGDSFADITPTGTNTFSDNLDLDPALASGAGSHAATFVNPLYGSAVDTSSDDLDTIIAIVRAAWAPIENGPAKKGDGTYMGALFPDGTLNDGTVYV